MTSVTLVRHLDARAEIVWNALVTPEGLRQWMGPDQGPVLVAETDPTPQGRFRLRFRVQDGREFESRGKYLEVDPPRRLVMSWGWEDEGFEHVSRVEIDLEPQVRGTRLVFTHSHLPSEDARKSHEEGWTGALDKLQRRLSDGVKS